jgi:hypothetical protein
VHYEYWEGNKQKKIIGWYVDLKSS